MAIVGDELTIALTREGRLALRWPDDVEEQLRLRVMDDPDLGPLARNLVLLWYTGGWMQLPADWRERNGASITRRRPPPVRAQLDRGPDVARDRRSPHRSQGPRVRELDRAAVAG